MTTEFVCIKHTGVVTISHDQVHAIGVRNCVVQSTIGCLCGNKRKRFGFIAESRRSVVAQQDRLFAQQKKIQIVIVIVIDPNRFGIVPVSDRNRGLLELTLAIDPQFRTRFRDDGQVRQTVIIKVRGGHGNDILNAIQSAVNGRYAAVAEYLHARIRPGHNLRGAVAINIGSNQTCIRGFKPVTQLASRQFHRLGHRQVGSTGGVCYIIDFRKETPLQIFRNRGTGLTLLDFLKNRLFTSGISGASGRPVSVKKLEVWSRQRWVQFRTEFKLFQ